MVTIRIISVVVFFIFILNSHHGVESQGTQQQQQHPLGYNLKNKNNGNNNNDSPLNIAIIGGGAAGTSAAYFLKEATKNENVPPLITLYESSNRIGGRTRYEVLVNPQTNESIGVELGASIFITKNQNLMKACETFNLLFKQSVKRKVLESPELGLWDGSSFIWKQHSWSWFNYADLIWRYGLSPLRARRLADTAANNVQLKRFFFLNT